jgi:hypothetical protein
VTTSTLQGAVRSWCMDRARGHRQELSRRLPLWTDAPVIGESDFRLSPMSGVPMDRHFEETAVAAESNSAGIDQILALGQVYSVFQPIIDLDSGSVGRLRGAPPRTGWSAPTPRCAVRGRPGGRAALRPRCAVPPGRDPRRDPRRPVRPADPVRQGRIRNPGCDQARGTPVDRRVRPG